MDPTRPVVGGRLVDDRDTRWRRVVGVVGSDGWGLIGEERRVPSIRSRSLREDGEHTGVRFSLTCIGSHGGNR